MTFIHPRTSIITLALFLTILFFLSISLHLNTNAVEPQKTIGVLMSSDNKIPKVEGLKKGLEGYQFVEGNNVNFHIKNANSNSDELPRLAEELVNEHPDVIFVTGESEALAAQKADQSTQIPIVFVGVSSAKDIGLIDSYNSPGKNITGVENYYLLLSGKRLEYFQRLLPEIKNITLIYDLRITALQPRLAFLKEVSQNLNLTLQVVPVGSREELLQAINGLDPKQVDGVMLLCSELMESVDVSQIAIEKRIPIMGVSEEQTMKGLFASYGMSYYEQGLQVSRLVAKVLKGENASLIPVEGPEKVEFIVNQETAKKLQLNLDPAGLACVSKFVE